MSPVRKLGHFDKQYEKERNKKKKSPVFSTENCN